MTWRRFSSVPLVLVLVTIVIALVCPMEALGQSSEDRVSVKKAEVKEVKVEVGKKLPRPHPPETKVVKIIQLESDKSYRVYVYTMEGNKPKDTQIWVLDANGLRK